MVEGASEKAQCAKVELTAPPSEQQAWHSGIAAPLDRTPPFFQHLEVRIKASKQAVRGAVGSVAARHTHAGKVGEEAHGQGGD
jgi:hypothetical protein